MHLRTGLAACLVGVPLALPMSAAPARAVGSDCAAISQVDTVSEDSDASSLPAAALDYAGLAAAAGGRPGAGVSVAVVDSGVSDPLGRLRRVPGAQLGQKTEVVDAHGTTVAGLITGPAQGGEVRGIAPGARVVDVRVYDSTDPGEDERGVTTAAVLEGLRWVQTHRRALGIRVVVVALAVPAGGEGARDPLRRVVRSLSEDVVIVAASGNRPAGESPYLADFATPAPGQDAAGEVFPAGYDEVLAVSATAGSAGESDASAFVLPNSQTDVAVPTAGSVGYALNGRSCTLPDVATSWAAGIVGGLAAVLVAAHPEEGPRQVVARIKATATGAPDAPTTWTGAGVVQPVEALTRDLAISTSGKVATDGLRERSEPPLRVGSEPADPLATLRGDLVWWGLVAGGVVGLAALLRPLLLRRARRRTP